MHVKVEVASDNLERLASVPAFQEGRVEVLVLHAVHGLPYERVAEICGCKVGTVKSRINRARNLLKRMLLGEFPSGQSLHAPPMRPRTQRRPTPASVQQGAGASA